MELDKLIAYLAADARNDRWIKQQLFQKAATQLTNAVNEHGIPAVRKAIKEFGYPAPFIVPTLIVPRYWLKRECNLVSIDSVQGYVTELDKSNAIRGGNLFTAGWNSGKRYYVTEREVEYYGTPISQWIRYGAECEECGTPFIRTSTVKCCDKCERKYTTKEYSYAVEKDLGFEKTKDIHYGIELEYENITARDVLTNLKGHALAKRDGSVRDGVEIVTRPACIKTHKEKLVTFYDNIKVKAQPNTGMHVHISKKRLSNYQIGFMMEFLNKSILIKTNEIVAGRKYSDNNYCKPNVEHTMTFRTADFRTKESEKYSPLNTSKPQTVEIRIFSSPESFEECAAKLDFVSALVQYSSPYSVQVRTLKEKFSWKVFLTFIEKNKKEFSHFYNYFIKSGKLSLEAV